MGERNFSKILVGNPYGKKWVDRPKSRRKTRFILEINFKNVK
jgi:hypothetical protein